MMIRRRVIVIVALAIMIFTATSSILSELQSAPAAFAGAGDHIIYSNDAPTIFSSQVDIGIVPLLLSQENISDAWSEVVTFSAWGDGSFVVRGVNIESYVSGGYLEAPQLTESVAHFSQTAALVGSRLMDRLDISPPCVIPLSGSYASHIELVQVVGWFETGSYMDDELLVSEEVARYLCNMPSDRASLIAVETDDPVWLEEVLSPDDARFALFNVLASKTAVVADEEVTISMDIRNWGAAAGEVTVYIEDDDTLIDEFSVALEPSAGATVERQIDLGSMGTHPLAVWLSGDFPARTSLDVSVVDPYLVISAPSRVILGSSFEIAVADYSGDPISAAEVAFVIDEEQGSVLTDDDGIAEITPPIAGSCSLTASHVEFDDASAAVEVIDLGTYPAEFLPQVESFVLSEYAISEPDDVEGVIVVENAGALGGAFVVPVLIDSSPAMVLNISLGPAELRSVPVTIGDIDVGTHTIQIGTFSLEFSVEPWFADEPDLVQLVLRYGGTGALSSGAAIPIYQAAKISEGNVAVALFSMGAISAVLTSLAISAAFAKEVREGRRKLGILRTIGASRAHIRSIVLPQALANGSVGAVVGVVAGFIVAMLLTEFGVFVAFGHALVFEPDMSLLALIAVGAALISVSSSLASAEIAAREGPIASIKNLDADAGSLEQADLEELLSDE
jgi:hypothetical protein